MSHDRARILHECGVCLTCCWSVLALGEIHSGHRGQGEQYGVDAMNGEVLNGSLRIPCAAGDDGRQVMEGWEAELRRSVRSSGEVLLGRQPCLGQPPLRCGTRAIARSTAVVRIGGRHADGGDAERVGIRGCAWADHAKGTATEGARQL